MSEEQIIKYLKNSIDEKGNYCYSLPIETTKAIIKYIDQLTNNWNELEEWLKEYINKKNNWYNNELSTHDKQYYGDSYYTTNYMLKKFLDKMKEIKEGNNVSSRD